MEASSQIDALKHQLWEQEQILKQYQMQDASRREFEQMAGTLREQAARVPSLENQLREARDQLQWTKKRADDADALREQNHALNVQLQQLHRLESESSLRKNVTHQLRPIAHFMFSVFSGKAACWKRVAKARTQELGGLPIRSAWLRISGRDQAKLSRYSEPKLGVVGLKR